jgi:hypothetical protein
MLTLICSVGVLQGFKTCEESLEYDWLDLMKYPSSSSSSSSQAVTVPGC